MKNLQNTHDLNLPKWGPYTKKYMGISQIPDAKKGLRFDLSVFPGFYRRKVEIPNVNWESGYHPWEASPDLTYYMNRHELEWKDRVYTDISFSEINDNARLIRCECVNRTDMSQNIVLHFMSYMNFPPLRIYSTENISPCMVKLPANAVWVDGLDYSELRFSVPRPTDNLVPDGLYRGEIRGNGFVNGSGIGDGFGKNAGDTITYCFSLRNPIKDGMILFRYRLCHSKKSGFFIKGIINTYIDFTGDEDFAIARIPAGNLAIGDYRLKMVSAGGCPVEMDGFCVVEASKIQDVRFTTVEWNPYPEICQGPVLNSSILKYRGVDEYYGLVWLFDEFEVREFFCDELDRFMRHMVHNHVSKILKDKGDGHFLDIFLRPVELKANTQRIIYGMVCSGRKAEVERQICNFLDSSESAEEIYISQRRKAIALPSVKEGKKYLFSQQMMAANTLSNVVYPVYAKRSFIKHYSPGRIWDCLYTWDSGLIGLGLLELDIDRAVECLNAYLTQPGDAHAAFIHHGTPVPVQIYLFLELWSRTQSKELLEYFYPRLRQYHNFLAGKLGSSNTRQLKSNLIKTWDYFYNSGGWDDYPPQVFVHEKGLEKYICPVANTAHCIRTAKILYMAADALGIKKDMEGYKEDIEILSRALLEHSWDEKSGYFGYVRHDENGLPTGILHHESGASFNMGMDGAYPLVAGICTDKQKEVLTGCLMNADRIWTDIGLSTVDQSAPYYKTDGYWNGAVWMPHQWFFWKAMLDLGRPELAYRIASTALEVWKTEVNDSYHCFEHFMVKSGRGAGWHQITSISSPVMSWFGAYYRPGRLTCGFDIWVIEKLFSDDNTVFEAKLKKYDSLTPNTSGIVVTMNPEYQYRVMWNDKEVHFTRIFGGTLEIRLNWDMPEGILKVSAST